MKIEEKLKKLLEKKSDLEHRLYLEQCCQHDRINSMGWGYGMRHAKINFSTTKEDRLLERIEKVNNKIAELSQEVK